MPVRNQDVQLFLQFPEYEFKVGDFVRVVSSNRFNREPFIVTGIKFYDKRSYEERVNQETGRPNPPLNKWWYFTCVSAEKVPFSSGERHYVNRHVAAHNLEVWRWKEEDSTWRL
jgi:hypothetical protein